MSVGFGFDFFETVFPITFFGIFFVIIGIFLFTAISGIRTWNKNNHSPRLTVEAKVVSKRMDVSRHTHHHGENHGHHTTTSTYYYATFEVESGDRMEFSVSGTEYGMLVEGDTGRLSFQGTRYLSFDRISDPMRDRYRY